jgi:hypothetical protein
VNIAKIFAAGVAGVALILALGAVKARALDPKTLAMDDYATCYSRAIKASGYSPSHECDKARSLAIELNGKAAVADQTRYMKQKFFDAEGQGAK